MAYLRKLVHPLRIWQFLLLNVVISILFILIFRGRHLSGWYDFLTSALWSFMIFITQWMGAVVINQLLDRHFKWMDRPVMRSITGVLSLVMYSLIAFIIVNSGMYYLKFGAWPDGGLNFAARSGIVSIMISLVISLTFTAIGFFRAWRSEVINSEKLRAQMLAYKYESLRNQLNPHFLFNSFNVLTDLVYSDQAAAVKFISQLSGLFRYVLDSRDKELVPLSEELSFMDSYLYLLKTRFGEKLKMEIDIEAGTNELIVPMTLQLLVENAVKHNEVSEVNPLIIRISRENLHLRISNTVKLKSTGDDSMKIGLKNIIQQYSVFTDEKVEVISDDSRFDVFIPVLKSGSNESSNS